MPLLAPVTTAVRRLMRMILPGGCAGLSPDGTLRARLWWHTDSRRGLTGPRRVAGILGAGRWGRLAPRPPASGGTAADALLWVGAALLVLALIELGLLLVRSDLLLLRLFVALALPPWSGGVLGLILGAVSDRTVVEAAFGAVVALISGVQLRPAEARASTRRL